MKRLLVLIVLLSAYSYASSYSFSKSKRLLKNIYSDHTRTFYCDCNYNLKNKGNTIDRASCGYEPRHKRTRKGNINKRARRIEWEHVMPAQNFGKHLPCWKNGGRKNCRKVSKKFKMMEADMMNLVPSIGELNGDRSNYRYSPLEATLGQYGSCVFQVDFKARKAHVRPEIRGDIARIYFYMSRKYNIPLSKQERRMMEVWDKQDPIDEWEQTKRKRIK